MEMSVKKAVSSEGFIFIGGLAVFFGVLAHVMGGINMINTLLNTAYQLLISTVFYIMAVAVIAGAFSELLMEFGVVAIINKLLSRIMKPVYGLPGASIVGVVTTYLSDNPAILTLVNNKNFKVYFKKYQMPALTNIATSFGMGMIISAFVIGLKMPDGEGLILPVIVGNIGAIIGSVVSVRLMLFYTARIFGTAEDAQNDVGTDFDIINYRMTRNGTTASRFMEAVLDGGKSGVDMGIAIIPGVLIICTLILLLTNGPSANGMYTGSAFEGVALIPFIGQKLNFILGPLFGFSSPHALSVPLTALGAAGASIGLLPSMIAEGLITRSDIAVFVAMCMCWSGYLSTHIAMMESMGFRKLSGKAILCHTLGGIAAGVSAHLIFKLVSLLL